MFIYFHIFFRRTCSHTATIAAKINNIEHKFNDYSNSLITIEIWRNTARKCSAEIKEMFQRRFVSNGRLEMFDFGLKRYKENMNHSIHIWVDILFNYKSEFLIGELYAKIRKLLVLVVGSITKARRIAERLKMKMALLTRSQPFAIFIARNDVL